MSATGMFGLRYQGLGDAPDGPGLGSALASDVDGWLSRTFPCTSFPGGVNAGFMAWRTDLGEVYLYDGSAWQFCFKVGAGAGGSGSSGGGASASSGGVWDGWQAGSTGQSIPSGADTIVAFPTALGGGDGVVTRSTSGAGHAFTLTQGKLWTITTTLQYASASSSVPGSGRKVEIRAGSTVIAKAGDNDGVTGSWSRTISRERRLAAGTVITVVTRHNQGAAVALDPESGPIVAIDFAGV